LWKFSPGEIGETSVMLNFCPIASYIEEFANPSPIPNPNADIYRIGKKLFHQTYAIDSTIVVGLGEILVQQKSPCIWYLRKGYHPVPGLRHEI
jgi:hypothetical protein